MNVSLVLVWYEEQPRWLYELVESVAGVCNHVVAVDGAYALFPHAKGGSLPEQSEAIVAAAAGHGMDLTLYQPACPWGGNEVEKRNCALRLANGADWLFILDGDERLLEAPRDLHERLANADKRSGIVTHRFNDRPDGECKKFYRTPVRIGSWHADYIGARGMRLVEGDGLRIKDVVVEHRKTGRVQGRQDAAQCYYELRDIKGIECRE